MPDSNSFISLCEKIRFSGDVSRATSQADTSIRLREYAFKMKSRGLRIHPALTPKLHHILATAATSLKLPMVPEAYVTAEPAPNAYAPIFGARDCPLIVLTSGIVELLAPLELQFVIGHELGHLGFGHPGLPEENRYANELECLKKLSLSRATEISADRLGLIATKSLVTAANVKIKLASGLTSCHIKPDVQSFINQIEQDSEGVSHEWELYQLHPSLPLRLWALLQFSLTSTYAKLTGQRVAGMSMEEADSRISEKLSALGDGKLSKMEQKNFDLAMVWLGASLVFDDKVIEAGEEELLVSLIGEKLAQKALRFAKEHGLDSVIAKLKDSLQRLDMNDARVKKKLMNTYEMFLQRVNVLEGQPKAYRVLKVFFI